MFAAIVVIIIIIMLIPIKHRGRVELGLLRKKRWGGVGKKIVAVKR